MLGSEGSEWAGSGGLDWMTVIQRKRAESYHFFPTHPEMEGSEWTGSGG